MIHVGPPEDTGALDRACAGAGAFDWIVFTSVNGVDHFMARLLELGDIRDLKGVRVCTVGEATAARVARYGIRVDVTPAEYRAEALVDALGAYGPIAGRRFLLPRADIARELLPDDLRQAGADVVEVAAYRTLSGTGDQQGDQDIYRMLLDREIDAVTFTSASTVRNFVQLFGQEQAADLLRTTVVASIGPVTAEAAQQLGIATTVMPERYTIPDLVDALVEHFAGEPAARGAGHPQQG
jgi:uroporphyrinogen III methyltransferase/synthase